MEKPIFFKELRCSIKLPTVNYDQITKLKNHASISEHVCNPHKARESSTSMA